MTKHTDTEIDIASVKKPPKIDVSKMTDDELKAYMITLLVNGTNFRADLKKDNKAIIRCYQLLAKDANFAKEYRGIMYYKIDEIEEDVLNGIELDNIPTKFDRYGNEDLSSGYLKRAELALKNKQWILERRHALYKAKSQQDITSDGQQLNALILPSKIKKDENE